MYVDKSDLIVFLSVTVSTLGRIYDDFLGLFFLPEHREASMLAGELPEDSEQFRFFRPVR